MISLRTLTEKSILGFGMFSDLKVGNLIRTNPQYLIWTYYNLSVINFSSGVLKALGINYFIQKPGTDIKYFEENGKRWDGPKKKRRRYGIQNVEVQSNEDLQLYTVPRCWKIKMVY